MARRKSVLPLLVGDVGGTNTRLSLYAADGKTLLREARFKSADYVSLEDIVLPFVKESALGSPSACVLGVAGPVRNGSVNTTNLPWQLNELDLQEKLAIPKVILANDLVVAAVGCLHTRGDSLTVLTPNSINSKGNHLAVLAAGTGLGQAKLIWTGDRHLPLATEGGHGDFAPTTPIQMEFWHFLSNRFPDHVSVERVLSGNGLGCLYDFFVARSGRAESKTVQKKLKEGKDRNVAISEMGLSGENRQAVLAVDLFAAIFGQEAGNLALRELCFGGIFVTGGMGAMIVPARKEIFLDAFYKKGRMAKLLADIPIGVVSNTDVGVQGALAMALGANL